MATHRFTLIVEGPDLQAEPLIDELYEAGCDDALAGRSHGAQCLDFDREAPSIDEAILSAIADLARLDDVEVVRIADAGLVSMASIAARTGRTSESVRLLVEGRRGPGAFPPPVTDPRGRHRLWRWAEVDRWFETAVPGHQLDDQEQVVTAINAALEFRRLRRCLPSEGSRALQELLRSWRRRRRRTFSPPGSRPPTLSHGRLMFPVDRHSTNLIVYVL